MLVLTRKTQQQIQIGDDIVVTILQVKGNQVRVGIEAPRRTRIVRSEIRDVPPKDRAEEGLTLRRALARAAVRSSLPATEANEQSAESFSSPEQRDATSVDTRDQWLTPLGRHRAPSASTATSIRPPQRLGPASLKSLSRVGRF